MHAEATLNGLGCARQFYSFPHFPGFSSLSSSLQVFFRLPPSSVFRRAICDPTDISLPAPLPQFPYAPFPPPHLLRLLLELVFFDNKYVVIVGADKKPPYGDGRRRGGGGGMVSVYRSKQPERKERIGEEGSEDLGLKSRWNVIAAASDSGFRTQ